MLKSFLLSSSVLALLTVTIYGADPKAVTDAAKADADFAVQGEYEGILWTACARNVAGGLQVIASGDGKFDAMLFQGGLPGCGWDGTNRWKLTGARDGNGLTLSGEPGFVRVSRAEASDGLSIFRRARRVERTSPTLGARPPAGAQVLFDGGSTAGLENGRTTDDGLLMVGTATKRPVRDFTLHLEFRTPYMPAARGQGRGNSGVYIQGRYEVQILDSFGLTGENNECGGLYKSRAPDVNMCLPPLSWQTYDIDFRAARFCNGCKVASACITVRHNGVAIHQNVAIPNKTGGGEIEGPAARPIKLQDHGNPVHFRNVWIVER